MRLIIFGFILPEFYLGSAEKVNAPKHIKNIYAIRMLF